MVSRLFFLFTLASVIFLALLKFQAPFLTSLFYFLLITPSQNQEKVLDYSFSVQMKPIITKNYLQTYSTEYNTAEEFLKNIHKSLSSPKKNSDAFISQKFLLLLITVSASLGFAVGILKNFLYNRGAPENTSKKESLSPELETQETAEKFEEIEFFDCNNSEMEDELKNMIDNCNFTRNFYDHYEIHSKKNEQNFIATHLLDGQNYLIKKIPICLKNESNLAENQVLKDISNLKKINSKYIARYITSWLEESEHFGLNMQENRKKLIICIQMEIYTDKILKDWLGNGIENKVLCLKVFKQITKGLKHIHEKNVFHGNLKSKNISLDRKRNVKITNFEIGKVSGDEVKVYQKKDIFNLALILFELFSTFESKEHRKSEIGKLRDNLTFPQEFVNNYDEVSKLVQIIMNQRDDKLILDRILKDPIIRTAF